jgi:hypothetical protein
VKKAYLWIKHRISHKIDHYSKEKIKDFLTKNGLAFVVIFLLWEIIEDVLFPLTFIWLGNNVNPWFLTGAPISWILCLHPIAVPALWWLWIKMKKTDRKIEHDCGVCDEDNRE